jgi:plastocyanin
VRKLVGGCLALAGAVGVAAVAGGAGHAATPKKVTVDMREFGFTVKPKTVAKGVVLFAVSNKGTIGHDFKIAGKKTPLVAAGGKRTLRVTFAKAGRYAYLCTLPSHATAGMKGVLVVR